MKGHSTRITVQPSRYSVFFPLALRGMGLGYNGTSILLGSKQPMKRLQHVRTRRQLFRVTAVSAASIPFLALTRNSVSAMGRLPPDPHPHPHQHYSCLVKWTQISTHSG